MITHYSERWFCGCILALLITMPCGLANLLNETKYSQNETRTESTDLSDFLHDVTELFISLKDVLFGLGETLLEGRILTVNTDTMLYVITHPSRILLEPVPTLLSLFNNLDMLRPALMNNLMDKAKCSLCHVLLRLLKMMVELNFSEQLLGIAIGLLLYLPTGTTPEMWINIGRGNAHWLYTSMRNSTDTFDEVCFNFVPYGCGTHKPMWTVPLQAKPNLPIVKEPLPPADAPILKYVVIADPHIDLYYQPGSYVPCAEVLCCQNSSTKTSGSMHAGRWGDMGHCDLSIEAFQNLLDNIKLNHPDAVGVFWLGDSISHNLWNTEGVKGHLDLMKIGLRMVKDTLGLPIYPTLGNHDSFPVNNFAPLSVTRNDSMDYFYNQTYDIWKDYIPAETKDSILKMGSYSISLKPNLRLIAVNNNYAYFLDFWNMITTNDPGGILAWLVHELQKAEDKQEKVIILIHIPPCSEEVIPDWSVNYHRIINRYNETVVAQLAGHTHYDHFCILHDEIDHNVATSVVYVCPSATTYDSFNMAYRIVTFDGDRPNTTYNFLDHETWYMDLQEANKKGVPDWKKEYSAKEAYKLPDLSPESWQNLVNSMKNGSNRDAIEKYTHYYTRFTPYEDGCDAVCEKDLICHMEMGRSRNRNECDVGYMY